MDPTLIAIVALFGGFCILDAAAPARKFPGVAWWRLKGVASVAVYLTLSIYAPRLWDAFLSVHTLVALRGLPLGAQAGAGFLALEFGIYVWHRTMHSVDFLWRHLHQMHHSAERVDIWGAFYFHPLDIIGFAFVGSLFLVGLLGVSAEAATIVTILVTFCGMFQHANLRTPRWLGYLIVRPESHAVHHERGVHGYNYSDLPLFDIVFGTFRNPKTWDGKAGFFEGGSARLWPLLIGRKLA